MTKRLKELIVEFKTEKARNTTNQFRQAKELQSIQKAIRKKSEQEKLDDDEKTEVSDIINITEEWWCNV